MAIQTVLIAPDPRLKVRSAPVSGVDDELRRLMDDMRETMYATNGIGLAAVQIGVPKRIIVMDLAGKDEPPAPRYFVNPEIIWRSEELAIANEGCLSVPDLYDDVERPARIKARYWDYQGQAREIEAEGLLSTCLQHEMDHLEGILFIDHLSRLKRSMILKKLAKSRRLAESA